MRCSGGLFWFAGAGKMGHFFLLGWGWKAGRTGRGFVAVNHVRSTKDG